MLLTLLYVILHYIITQSCCYQWLMSMYIITFNHSVALVVLHQESCSLVYVNVILSSNADSCWLIHAFVHLPLGLFVCACALWFVVVLKLFINHYELSYKCIVMTVNVFATITLQWNHDCTACITCTLHMQVCVHPVLYICICDFRLLVTAGPKHSQDHIYF